MVRDLPRLQKEIDSAGGQLVQRLVALGIGSTATEESQQQGIRCQHLGQGSRVPVLSAGHSPGLGNDPCSLVNGLRVSHISVIIQSFGSFEFLIIRHKLKYPL